MYEYKVVPAPQRARKVKGLKTTAERFAHHLAERINAEAAGGWEFLRTETLSCEERSPLGRARRSTQTMMVFARPIGQLRPDTGVALAAAQGGVEAEAWTGVDPEPRYEAEDYPELPEAEAAYAAIEQEDARAPSPMAPDQTASTMGRRQEPLFRGGGMLHGEPSRRPEPVLRPRARPEGSED